MPHTPAVFAIDAIEGLFHGITAGQRWNGWACPMFSFEEANRLTALNNDSEFCGSISYDADKDAFLFRSEDQDGDFAEKIRPRSSRPKPSMARSITPSVPSLGAGRTSRTPLQGVFPSICCAS